MQVTKSKPIGKQAPRTAPEAKPEGTQEKDQAELDQERPRKGTDVESERSFYDSNKRTDPEPDAVKGGPS